MEFSKNVELHHWETLTRQYNENTERHHAKEREKEKRPETVMMDYDLNKT